MVSRRDGLSESDGLGFVSARLPVDHSSHWAPKQPVCLFLISVSQFDRLSKPMSVPFLSTAESCERGPSVYHSPQGKICVPEGDTCSDAGARFLVAF